VAATTLARARNTVKRRFTPTWRYVFNLGPTLEHRRHPPVLGEAARAVLDRLRVDGAASTTLEELTGDATLLPRLQELARALEAEQAERLEERRRQMMDGTFPGHKDYVVFLLGRHPTIDPESVLAQVALHGQLKGIADAYFGLRTAVADINLWRTFASNRPPRSSQLWHRDLQQDHHVLKLFVHLEDVVEGGGPFSYALGTHTRRQREPLPEARHDGMTLRSHDDELAEVVPRERWRAFTGPAGSVVFADTIGYHRGGWATTTPRLLYQALYASQASTRDYQLRLPPGVDPKPWEKDLLLARNGR